MSEFSFKWEKEEILGNLLLLVVKTERKWGVSSHMVSIFTGHVSAGQSDATVLMSSEPEKTGQGSEGNTPTSSLEMQEQTEIVWVR
ncbi:hypothetical protein AVEN_64905-1 [Araneus ventricosus]|uniref:Uncharacterized protein n=1 Tax=Araneus ventricosus TaxID=182803 RepID=A0A4Y2LU65_ARAVE|nr:hypothetical protein AVEN_64905-1 [Araneus ventricosus]